MAKCAGANNRKPRFRFKCDVGETGTAETAGGKHFDGSRNADRFQVVAGVKRVLINNRNDREWFKYQLLDVAKLKRRRSN
jgi:hypothetical protein